MKIINYTQGLTEDKVRKLAQNGWFCKKFTIEQCANRELAKFREGFVGIDVRRLSDYHSDDSKKLILIDQPLSNGSFVSPEQKNLLLCTKDFPLSIHPVILIGIYSEKWFSIDLLNCQDRSCLFGSSYDAIEKKLCPTCQKKLTEYNRPLNALRILLFFSLNNRQMHEIDRFLELPLGDALRDLDIHSQHPAIAISATNQILDTVAAPGKEKRSWLSDSSREITQEKTAIKESYVSHRFDIPKFPTLIAARRWNSWTPNQPGGKDTKSVNNKIGGGYLVSDGETNLAIDPGYGFLRMLYGFHKISVMDIDAVLISHDHPDHSSELSSLLSLRYEYQSDCSPLNVMLNPSSFYLHQRTLEYYSKLLTDEQPHKLFPGESFTIGKLKIDTIGMYHDEIFHHLSPITRARISREIGESQSLGLKIRGETLEGETFHFAIPGDTSLPSANEELEKIAIFYRKPDIAAIHLGSLEKDWYSKTDEPASRIDYGEGKHLGITGAAKLINMLQPRLGIITEFGEELHEKDYRLAIIDILKEALITDNCTILPSDIPLYIILKDRQLLCKCECNCGYIPVAKADCVINEGYIHYKHPAGCKSGLNHIAI